MMSNLFPTFKTFLTPGSKIGKLAFTKLKGHPNDPNIPVVDEVLEADFSRPDVGDSSGAIIFDKEGNLKELAEDAPDWNWPIGGGCPRILMRPQSQNLCSAPRDISTASKVNVTIPDASTIREDGSAASEFFAFQDFSGFSSSTDYTMIIEVEPVGGRNFRLQEGLGSSAITNIDFELETASGSASLIKQGNGRFFVFLPITTGASQTSIRFLMRVLDDSLNTSFDGDVNKGVNITLRDIQAGHDNISPIPNNVTRSANQFEFTDLVTKGVLTEEAGTFLFNPSDFKSKPSVTGAFMLGLSPTNPTTNFFGFASEGGNRQRPAYVVSGAFLKQSDFVGPETMVFTYDSEGVRVYKSTGLVFSDATLLPSTFSSFKVNSLDRSQVEFGKVGLAFAPFALSEAQALAAISEAQNL